MSLKVRRISLILLLLVMLAVFSAGLPGAKTTKASSASPLLWPYNQPTNITFNLNDVVQAWNEWKAGHITSVNAGGDGRLRVMGGQSNATTVSEGMSYGILFASLLDDQAALDGLWLFVRDHLDDKGLMHWHIGNPGQYVGTGAATDADEDIALGMVNACVKSRHYLWSESPFGLDYCAIATDMINAILTHEVGPGGELYPGDSWNMSSYANGLVNLSYFSPGHYKVFGKFTGQEAAWDRVIARNYQIAQAAQSQPGNCSKLVPDWNDNDGVALNPGFDAHYNNWYYDAMRFAWRISVDRVWYNTPNAIAATNQIGSFFSSVGIQNVKDEFTMDGTIPGVNHNAFPVANDAAPIWAATSLTPVMCGAAGGTLLTTPQQAYDEVLAIKELNSAYTYYNNAWRLFSMLLMTGNFPNLYELGASIPTPTPTSTYTPGGPTITPTASFTPSATPTVTFTPTMTNTPSVGGLKMQIKTGDTNPLDDNQRTDFNYQIVNNNSSALSNISVRLYYTAEGGYGANYKLEKWWDGSNAATISPTGTLVYGDIYYVTVDYGNASLPAGGSWVLATTFHLGDWSAGAYDSSNDWWHTGFPVGGLPTTYVDTQYLAAYINGSLAWGNVPPSPLVVQLETSGGQLDNNQQTDFDWRVVNTSNTPLTNISVRLYYTAENDHTSDYTLEKWYDESGSLTITSTGTLATGDIYFIEANYGSAVLLPGAGWKLSTTFHVTGWPAGPYDSSNDWWHTGYSTGQLPPTFVNTSYIPAYINGQQVWGNTPPGGIIALPTNTPTPTVDPNLPTNTPPPPSALKAQIEVGDTNPLDDSQRTDFNYTITNTSGSPVSGVSVRLYYTSDGSYGGNYTLEKWFDGSNAATISSTGTQVYGSVYYITVDYGTATLNAGASWTLATTLHLHDWSVGTYDASNDWWHQGFAVGQLPANYMDTPYIPVYVGGTQVWGSTPPGAVKAQIKVGDTNPLDDSQRTDFNYTITNTSGSALSDLSLRLYYTADGSYGGNYTLEKWWDGSNAATISLTGTLVGGNLYYITVDYGNAVLDPGASWTLATTLHLHDWSTGTYDSGNDWWHGGFPVGGLPTSYADTLYLPVYEGNNVIWGYQPSAPIATSTPAATETLAPTPTATLTATPTPTVLIPSNTPAPTTTPTINNLKALIDQCVRQRPLALLLKEQIEHGLYRVFIREIKLLSGRIIDKQCAQQMIDMATYLMQHPTATPTRRKR